MRPSIKFSGGQEAGDKTGGAERGIFWFKGKLMNFLRAGSDPISCFHLLCWHKKLKYVNGICLMTLKISVEEME